MQLSEISIRRLGVAATDCGAQVISGVDKWIGAQMDTDYPADPIIHKSTNPTVQTGSGVIHAG